MLRASILFHFMLIGVAMGAEGSVSGESDSRSCRQKCQRAARQFYRECIEQGGTEDHCSAASRALLERCVEKNCVPDCLQQCEDKAVRLYRHCIEEGHDEEDCAHRARSFHMECLHEHCPMPPSCDKRCENLAREVDRLCLHTGGSPEECGEAAREFALQCKIEHCGRCGGIAGIPCPQDQFCLLPPGTCEVSDQQGICLPMPGGCPDVYEPVCGCDGQTYANACEASVQGVTIRSFGPCQQSCGGHDDPACQDTHYCYRIGGGCPTPDTPGICRFRPPAGDSCPGPVCGCDGKSYPTACHAAAAGTAFESVGLCHAHECDSDEACSGGSFCEFAPGQCDVDRKIGICVEIPEDCSGDTSIVCGCDGQTYSMCQARMAEVSIDHAGFCEPQYCGGDPVPTNPGGCRPGSFCEASGGCDILGGGVCRVIPTQCPEVYDPVCGCDGQTYPNGCEAAKAGVSLDYLAACASSCGGPMGQHCSEGQFCLFPLGECDISDNTGECAPIPDACPQGIQWVCGCDGRSYANTCHAGRFGASIDYLGQCRCGGIEGMPCADMNYCKLSVGHCDDIEAEGFCVWFPPECSDAFDPVCGCDGVTYINECQASMVGVSLAHREPCK